MLTTEPVSPTKDLIDAIQAQLESIQKLLSMLRKTVDAELSQKIAYQPTPQYTFFTPEDLKHIEITCDTESK